MIQNPNKIYIIDYTEEINCIGKQIFIITLTASSIEVAREYIKEQIGIDVQPMLIPSAVYPTIYVSDGSVPKEIQAKILYNGSYLTE